MFRLPPHFTLPYTPFPDTTLFRSGLEIEISPVIHGARRRSDFLGPVPEFERGCYADAGNPVALARLQLFLEMLDARCDDPHDLFRLRIGIGLMVLETYPPDEIHQHEIGTAAADLDRKSTRLNSSH